MPDNRELAFNRLCVNLGRTEASLTEEVEDYIGSKLDAAAVRLRKAGVDLSDGEADTLDLWIMYAAYLYNRRDSNEPMPMSLRLAINDAKVAAATKGADT